MVAAPTIPGVAVNSSLPAGNTSQIVVRGLDACQCCSAYMSEPCGLAHAHLIKLA